MNLKKRDSYGSVVSYKEHLYYQTIGMLEEEIGLFLTQMLDWGNIMCKSKTSHQNSP